VRANALVGAALVATVLAGPACHERRVGAPEGREQGIVGSYKGVIGNEEGRTSRFHLLLWAELPDRIHAEFLPPVGGPEVVVDGGGGRLAVTLVGEGAAYVGPASRTAVEAVVGVPVPMEDLVRWILVAADPVPPDVAVTRSPERAEGLPKLLEIRAGGRMLRIERKGVAKQRGIAAGAGTGAAPPGVAERPLGELPRAAASFTSDEGKVP
jgi:hypothetical protein